jgi:ribokinase
MNHLEISGEILCMGSINMDLVMFMPQLPGPGETVVTDNFSTFPGGKGGNQAVTAAVLGGKVRYFGKLAQDTFSHELIEAMSSRGVETGSILRDAESTAGIAIIRVDAKGQNSISFTPGANGRLTPQEVHEYEHYFKPGAILLITGEIKPETIYEAIRVAHQKGMFVIFDPAPVPPQPFPSDIPACVDVLKPNESEATLITGVRVVDAATAEQAIQRMREMGFGAPVVTLGDRGAVAYVDGSVQQIPAIPMKVIDTTAAGDVFSGALAASLSRASALREALHFATAAAALSTTVAGAQTSIPSLSQVEALVKREHVS